MNFTPGYDLPGRDFKLNGEDRLTFAIDIVRGKAGWYTYRWSICLQNYRQFTYPVNRPSIWHFWKSINNWFMTTLDHPVCLWVVSQYYHFFYPISSCQFRNNILIFQSSVNYQFFKATIATDNIFPKKIRNSPRKKSAQGLCLNPTG